MKPILGLVVVLLALCGCAVAPTGTDVDSSELDVARMNAVEQAATRAGVRVYWLNAPRRTSRSTNG